MVPLTSELAYVLYLYEEIVSQHGSEADISAVKGYAKDLMQAVDHMFDCPESNYILDEEMHNAIINLGRKYYD